MPGNNTSWQAHVLQTLQSLNEQNHNTVSFDMETIEPHVVSDNLWVSPPETNQIHGSQAHYYAPDDYVGAETQSMYTPKPRKKKKVMKDRLYNQVLVKAFSRQIKNRVSGEIGLEIEVEGDDIFDSPIAWWQTTIDHSLRASDGIHEGGLEYRLKTPISRSDVPKALKYLSVKLKQAGSKLIFSPRTSVHVHVNVQQELIRDIYTYICMYMIFEEALVELAGKERVGNLFCLRAKDAEYWAYVLQKAIESECFEGVFDDSIRYTSCNTSALGKFGSLEFRAMRGTVDQELITDWVNILCLLKDKAKSFSSPAELATHYSQVGPAVFFKEIFGDAPRLALLVGSVPKLEDMMKSGSRLMRDVAFCSDWEEAKIKDKTTEEPPPQTINLADYPEIQQQEMSNMYVASWVVSSNKIYSHQTLNGEYSMNTHDKIFWNTQTHRLIKIKRYDLSVLGSYIDEWNPEYVLETSSEQQENDIDF